jgi:hypothetical protein
MKIGVYINHKNDNSNLCYFNGETLEAFKDLTVEDFDIDFEYDVEENTLHAVYSQLEYLGDL